MDTRPRKHKEPWFRALALSQALNNLPSEVPALQVKQHVMIFRGFGAQHVKVEIDSTLLIPQAQEEKATALNDLISEILAYSPALAQGYSLWPSQHCPCLAPGGVQGNFCPFSLFS